MRNPTKSPLSLALVALVLLAAAPAWPQPTTGDTAQQADEHFRQGKALLKAGKKREAREEYLAAFRLKQSHDVAGNLGNVELALGMPRDAAEHLSFAIRHYAPSGTTPEQLEKARQRLAEARRQVGTVTVSVGMDGAEVLVDGASVGRAPIEGDVFVEPGTRTISARLAGHEEAKQVIEAGKGTIHVVALAMVPIAPRAPGPTVPPPAEERREPSTGAIAAGGATAGAGLVAGVMLTVLANGKKSDAAAKREALVLSHATCTTAHPTTACAALADADNARATLSNAAVWSYLGAGVVGAGTLVYALVARKTGPTSGVRVVPIVGAQGGGLVMQGAW